MQLLNVEPLNFKQLICFTHVTIHPVMVPHTHMRSRFNQDYADYGSANLKVSYMKGEFWPVLKVQSNAVIMALVYATPHL